MQVTVQAHVCTLTVGCKGGMQLRWWFGILFGVLVDFRKIDAGCLGGCCLGCSSGWRIFARLTAGFCLVRSSGCVLLEVLVLQALLSGVYAGVISSGTAPNA